MQRVSTAPSLLIQTQPLLQKPSAIHLTTPSTLPKTHTTKRVASSSSSSSPVDIGVTPSSQQKQLFNIKKSNSDVISNHHRLTSAAAKKVSEGIEVNAPPVVIEEDDTTITSSSSSSLRDDAGQQAPSPQSIVVVKAAKTTTENGLQVDVTESATIATASKSQSSSSLLTPPSEDDQDSKSSPPQTSTCEAVVPTKRRKSNGVRKAADEAVRKSIRITRTCDPSAAEFVDNYVDSKRMKQPRIVQPPKGGVRIPHMVPRNKSTKEKDKLSIDMVGPRTRSSLAEPVSPLGGTRRRNTHVELAVKVGPDHQASFEPFYASDFVAPSQAADDEPDREELIWREEPSGSSRYSNEEMDDVWLAVRSQYAGKIGLDAVMNCLMKQNYSPDALLENIEVEQWMNLPQPFEDLNVAQQREFERVLRDLKGKNFAAIQDKFMRQYYLGEITKYYYDSKRRSCIHERYTRCTCREKLTSAVDVQVPRYECANCTKYLWEGKSRPPKYCAVCQLYFRRNGHHRNVVGKLFESDERIVKRWIQLEKDNNRIMSSSEVLEWLEAERREAVVMSPDFDEIPTHPAKKKLNAEQIMDLTQKFKPVTNPRCALQSDFGSLVSRVALEGFSDDEILKIVRAFKKVGKKFAEVSKIVGNRTPQEISIFYRRYRLQYHLDALFESSRKAVLPPIIASSIKNVNAEISSSSPTPEPVCRRKRAGSDPSYPEGDVIPIKTTRITRQSAASILRDPVEKEHNGRS